MRHTFYNKALAATLILTAGLAAGPFKADAQWRTDIPADFSVAHGHPGGLFHDRNIQRGYRHQDSKRGIHRKLRTG